MTSPAYFALGPLHHPFCQGDPQSLPKSTIPCSQPPDNTVDDKSVEGLIAQTTGSRHSGCHYMFAPILGLQTTKADPRYLDLPYPDRPYLDKSAPGDPPRDISVPLDNEKSNHQTGVTGRTGKIRLQRGRYWVGNGNITYLSANLHGSFAPNVRGECIRFPEREMFREIRVQGSC